MTGIHRRRLPRSRVVTGRPLGVALVLLAALWLVTLFDPQWLLAARGFRGGLKLPVFLFLGLAATLALSAFTVKDFGRRWTWYAPLFCFIAVAIASSAFTLNLGRSRDAVQVMLLYWTLVTGTAALVDTARRAELLLLAYGLQFVWWGLWGSLTGLVYWHPALANFDGFGAWMVIGGGLCSFLILASDNKWLRRALMLAVALCAVGVVASFARGAFLAAVAVLGVVWLRSPRKGRALAWGLACAALFATAASVLYGEAYWAEMATIFEGTSEETGEDRWVMWRAAWEIFLARPILGAGPENWGVFAATYFRPGDVGSVYAFNPSMLYGRQLHSSYFQTLAELGILGIMTFGWIFWDFWRRNAFLRSARAAEVWKEMGGRLALRPVALGLEAALVGWMAVAAFYSLSGTHWFYTILGLNLLLHSLVTAASHTGRHRHRHMIRRPLMSSPRFAAGSTARLDTVSPSAPQE